MKLLILMIIFLTGCSHKTEHPSNIVDQSAEFACRTEFEIQKMVGNRDCFGMAHYGCHMVVDAYLPEAKCNTPDTDFKRYFTPAAGPKMDPKEDEENKDENSK